MCAEMAPPAFIFHFYEEMLTIVRFGFVLSVDDRSADSDCDRASGQAKRPTGCVVYPSLGEWPSSLG